LTTVKNPQANGILKRTHQVIRNLLHSSCLITQDLCTVAAWQEHLMPVMSAINTTFHTTLFNCDMIFPTLFITNWLVCHQQSQTSSITICYWCQKPQMNFASMTKFSSIVTLEIYIWVNSLSPLKVLTRLLMYNNSQSMVPFSGA
jgi:hypothetical protein